MKLGVRAKLLGSAGVLLVLMGAIGLLAIASLSSVNDRATDLYAGATVPIEKLSVVSKAFLDKQRALVYGGLIDDVMSQAKLDEQIAADDTAMSEALAAYERSGLSAEEQAQLAVFTSNEATYEPVFKRIRVSSGQGDLAAAKAGIDSTMPIAARMLGAIDKMSADHDIQARTLFDQVQSTFQSGRILTLLFLLVAVAVGLGVAMRVARGITGGVRAVQEQMSQMRTGVGQFSECLAALARNDLTASYEARIPAIERYGTDEIGQTAAISNDLVAELASMVGSYDDARAGLAIAVGEVRAAASGVARTSSELNAAAGQTGAASDQIASTISQVAAGASDQARAAGETSGQVQELTAVIAQVEAGAADTARQMEGATGALERMTSAIANVSAASDEVDEVAATAALAVAEGLGAVEESVAGMARIKDAVEDTATKVTELGAKSGEIGAIVDTINEIAEQTNLLALNAAIEAARAGEQGKGFAVVADEVRKLAERSRRATKEIGGLIAEVQRGTSQAVAAMKRGAEEVAQGAELTDRTGDSLEGIAEAIAGTKSAVVRITAAVESMRAAASGVVAASDGIATIAAQTNAAAARMTGASGAVARAVDSIAAVSEQNSAAAQEVSAATEEMSAQAEEVVAAAASLSDMAAQLDALVARFRLEAEGSREAESRGEVGQAADGTAGGRALEATVIHRRRASDWGGGSEGKSARRPGSGTQG